MGQSAHGLRHVQGTSLKQKSFLNLSDARKKHNKVPSLCPWSRVHHIVVCRSAGSEHCSIYRGVAESLASSGLVHESSMGIKRSHVSTGASAARVMCERPALPNTLEALSVDLGLQGLIQQGRKKEVAKRLPHVVEKCSPNCVSHCVQKNLVEQAVTDGLPLWEQTKKPNKFRHMFHVCRQKVCPSSLR